MVLMVSGRTDIVAFYTEWFINRYKEGYVDVRNPFNPKMVSRIDFKNVDMIFFCTKNPLPIIKYLKEIDKPILFHVTLTGYNKDIEPNVIDKNKIIDGIKEISNIIGKDNIVIRYDPILINNKYTINYHVKAFDKLCNLLDGYVSKMLISFIDNYKNVRRNMKYLNYRELSDIDYEIIGKSFYESANKHGISVHTCFENRDLTEYGFIKDDCLSKEVVYRLTGKVYNQKWKARKENKCNCVTMVDIGAYNTCNHLCKYCYANYDEVNVKNNMKLHDKNSSLLIGHIEKDDIIKERFK